jgi:hypothetical protein
MSKKMGEKYLRPNSLPIHISIEQLLAFQEYDCNSVGSGFPEALMPLVEKLYYLFSDLTQLYQRPS